MGKMGLAWKLAITGGALLLGAFVEFLLLPYQRHESLVPTANTRSDFSMTVKPDSLSNGGVTVVMTNLGHAKTRVDRHGVGVRWPDKMENYRASAAVDPTRRVGDTILLGYRDSVEITVYPDHPIDTIDVPGMVGKYRCQLEYSDHVDADVMGLNPMYPTAGSMEGPAVTVLVGWFGMSILDAK